jgi:3-phosphoshikimate 1-carboxyvinyltransferase
VRGTNLDPRSEQPDRRLPQVVADLLHGIDRLDGRDRTVDCAQIPDQLMNLVVLAAARPAATRFVGAAHLRDKECDRLAVSAREFRRAGLDVAEHADGLTVRGGARPPRTATVTLDPAGDHRMAMAFAVLGSLDGGIAVADPGCVDKSFPGFFDTLAALHAAPEVAARHGQQQLR